MKVNLTEKEKEYLGIEDDRKDFYFKVENAVVDNYEMFETIYEYAVFITLSRYCNCNGISFASCETLAKHSHCSPRKIKDVLKTLVEKGLIKKIKRGGNSTDIYKVQTLKDYFSSNKKEVQKSIVHDVHHNQSAQDAPPVVHNTSSHGAHGAHNKELLKKNTFKKNTTTKTIKKETNNLNKNFNSSISKNSSSNIFDFLDLEEFKKINNITKRNIRKNIKELSLEKFREIYTHTENFISQGNGISFDAILYKGLIGEWNFDSVLNTGTTSNNTTVKSELDNEREDWLRYFSGIKSDPSVYNYTKSIIKKIPVAVLLSNKKKLGAMNPFQFKNHLNYLTTLAHLEK